MEDYLTILTDYLLTQSWQIAILVVVVAAISWLLRNKSAHVRYLLWLIVLAKCITPPMLDVPIAVLPEKVPAPAVMPTPLPTINEAPPEIQRPIEPISVAAPLVHSQTQLSARQWLAIAWMVCAAAFACIAAVKARRTMRWLQHDRRPLPADVQIVVNDLLSSLNLRRRPKMWLLEGIGQPFVWGALRGDIYLPATFVLIQDDEYRRHVLGHEISHVMRFDAAINLLQVIAQAIFWFHPFVWWANKRIRAEREKCCDEMAIARLNAKVTDYSRAIVETLVTEYESIRPVPSLAVAGPAKNIEERIRTMLRPGKKFYKRPSLPAVSIVILTVLLSAPTTVVLTVRGEDHPKTKSADTDRTIGNPTNLGPTVNSSDGDWDPSISYDGLSLYFASQRPGGYGNNDLYVTNRTTTDDPWGTTMNLGPVVNSSGWDNAPSISADGLSLYFSSDRSGGYGELDLWVTRRETTSAPWGMPVNLGPTVNGPANEHGPCISIDGLSLYFAERCRRVGPFRPGGLGYGDIWVTTRITTADSWGKPVNLGPVVNSSVQDSSPDISADQRMLFFSSFRGGSGDLDLWVTMRSSIEDDWATPVNLGPNVNSSWVQNTPNISIDGSILYFSSQRPGTLGVSGDSDIWKVSLKWGGVKE